MQLYDALLNVPWFPGPVRLKSRTRALGERCNIGMTWKRDDCQTQKPVGGSSQ